MAFLFSCMSIYQILYLSFLAVAFVISLMTYKSFKDDKSLKVFPILLGISILTEAIVNILHYVYYENYTFIYHLYLPVEYSFLAYFFYHNNHNKLTKYIISLSIPFYFLLSATISLGWISIDRFPGFNFALEGIILIIWSIITLFSIQPILNVPITRLPIFWICLGILIFHSGSFFFVGVFEYLLSKNSGLAYQLHRIIIKGLNYILYICFSTAFICSNQMKKFL